MDRNVLLTIVLSVGVILAWSWLFPPEPPPEQPETAVEGTSTPGQPAGTGATSNGDAVTSPIGDVDVGASTTGSSSPSSSIPGIRAKNMARQFYSACQISNSNVSNRIGGFIILR